VLIDRPAFNAAYAYGTQISVFAAIATVFAALGVDGNIYSPFAAQQATGAGWLLTAIVDLLWIFFFTSPPSSPALRITSTLGGPRFRRSNAANPVTKISRSTDAFAMGALHGGNAGMSQGPSVPLQDQKPMSGHWSGTPGRNTMGSIPGSEGNNGLEAQQGGGAPLEATHDPRVSQAPSSLPDSAAKCRAEALFDCAYNFSDSRSNMIEFSWKSLDKGSNEDPNELAFKKGDTLLIFDMSSKWWEAKTLDGKKGSAYF
jgi:SHO1 osmosensor